MQLDRSEIGRIVEEVVRRVAGTTGDGALKSSPFGEKSLAPAVSANEESGIFATQERAIEAAERSYQELARLTLEKRKEIIEAMRDTARSHARELAEMAVQETGLGRVEDKIRKNNLVADKTPGIEDLESVAHTGDRGLTLIEMAPYKLIGSITPSTNPAATIINNSIGMIASGNAVVFNPHPGAKKVSLRAIEILNQAIRKVGGPSHLLTSIAEPTIETSQATMRNPKIRLLVVTGGPGVVRAAMQSGKRTIAAGPGNPPSVVDETADIPKAARAIVDGSSFDNNIMCQCEKEVFAVDAVFDQLKKEMTAYSAYELSPSQLEQLLKVITKEGSAGCPEATMNRDFIGKDARVLARAIGLDVPTSVRVLISEVDRTHPLVMTEQMMPVLPLVRVGNVQEAMDLAVKAEKGNGHSASMHSRNVENLSNMAHRIDTAIFVKNAPIYSGLGYGGEGNTTMTIGCLTGEGITSARHFTRTRRCVLVDYFRII
ncbi:MAG: aldehyde dehydrogenase EutE [Armatimonadetes bacterium]|nr:aldehyde dehydrogenase EutE [Armatimonadota bacterium]